MPTAATLVLDMAMGKMRARIIMEENVLTSKFDIRCALLWQLATT